MARGRPERSGTRNGGTARPWWLPPATTAGSGPVTGAVRASAGPPRWVVTNRRTARPSFSRAVRAGVGAVAGGAGAAAGPPQGTISGAPATARVGVLVWVADGSLTGRVRLPGWRSDPPVCTLIGMAYLRSPASIRAIVFGLRGTARSPIRVPGRAQSIAAAAGSTAGSTTWPRQESCGQQY